MINTCIITFRDATVLREALNNLKAKRIISITPYEYENRNMGETRQLISVVVVYKVTWF